MAKKLALMLAGVLVALVAAELLVRAAGAAPKVYAIRKGRFQLSHNPKIGYEPVPLVYAGRELSFYDYLGASNSLGFRDREHAVAKPANVYRIVVLGDSIAAGLHVERNEDVFPPILERLLVQDGLRAEVINLAVSGYNTQQEVEMLREKGLQYHPDLVVVAYTMSSREHLDGDILKTLLEAEQRQGGVSSARVSSWLVKSALYRFVRFRVLAVKRTPATATAAPAAPAATATTTVTPDAAGTAPAAASPTQHYLDLVSADTVAPYFGVLRDLARQHHFQVLIAVFPRFVRTFSYYTFGRQHQFVADLAKANGFALVDLLVPFSDCRRASAEPISSDNFHPSPSGHRCAAAAIARAVMALPPRPPSG
ncbi:MAG TPA: GDSL-type esterase/lipase family protein [Thermoanaerobaculia bacterium]|nr:GDSL-type esterase/lipase family protein [Thermoanaerobaculia bacterium]